jgi:hypothetical protein
MNLALIDAVIDGLGVPAISAELAPEPGLCCVKVSSRAASHGTRGQPTATKNGG